MLSGFEIFFRQPGGKFILFQFYLILKTSIGGHSLTVTWDGLLRELPLDEKF